MYSNEKMWLFESLTPGKDGVRAFDETRVRGVLLTRRTPTEVAHRMSAFSARFDDSGLSRALLEGRASYGGEFIRTLLFEGSGITGLVEVLAAVASFSDADEFHTGWSRADRNLTTVNGLIQNMMGGYTIDNFLRTLSYSAHTLDSKTQPHRRGVASTNASHRIVTEFFATMVFLFTRAMQFYCLPGDERARPSDKDVWKHSCIRMVRR